MYKKGCSVDLDQGKWNLGSPLNGDPKFQVNFTWCHKHKKATKVHLNKTGFLTDAKNTVSSTPELLNFNLF